MDEHIVFLSFGSNLGDKQQNIETAYREIEKRIGKIVSQSAFYVTEPYGFDSENKFLNSVCQVYTLLDINKIFNMLLEIEKKTGRTGKSVNCEYTDRIIDIDILMYDDLVMESHDLTVPHPRFHLRDFVLIPFVEIAPDTIHPVLKKSIEQLKSEIVDNTMRV